MDNLIASKKLKAIDPNKGEIEVVIGIGAPYQDKELWRCRAYLSGIRSVDKGIASDESWQSLILALKLIKQMLIYFEEDGGRLYWPKSDLKTDANEIFSNFSI